VNKLEQLERSLDERLKLFDRIPSGTNLILAFSLIEKILLEKSRLNLFDVVEKDIDKFDKLKNLALGTNFIPERKLAFSKSLELFEKIIKNNSNGTK